MENVSKCFCHTCNEDTPHHEETVGRRCEVCFSYADSQQWSSEVDDEWLVNFWRAKYFVKGFTSVDFGSGDSKTILIHAGPPSFPKILGEFPQDHVAIAVVDFPNTCTPPYKLAAGTILPEPLPVEEKYFPPSKSKFHK